MHNLPLMGENGNGRLRVLIADDHSLFAETLEALLSSESEIKVVGRAANGEEAVGLVREERPDIVLMDIAMPVMDGLTALPLVKQVSPKTQVAMFSAFDSPEIRDRAEALGAADYIRKGTAPEELVARLRALCNCRDGARE